MPLPTINGEQFGYVNNFTLNIASVALTDFQVKKTIAWVPHMKSDFADLRFTTLDGTVIPHWIESKTDSVTADIWMKIPTISDINTTPVLMYYGNPDASSTSNADNVFDFYDDFSDNNYDGWTVQSGTWSAASGYLTQTAAGGWNGISIPYVSDSAVWEFDMKWAGDTTEFKFMDETGIGINENSYGVYLLSNVATSFLREHPTNTNHITFTRTTGIDSYKVTRNASGLTELFINDVSKGSFTDTTIADSQYMSVWAYDSGIIFDNIRVRQYTATEPTWAADTGEQHQRIVPQFI